MHGSAGAQLCFGLFFLLSNQNEELLAPAQKELPNGQNAFRCAQVFRLGRHTDRHTDEFAISLQIFEALSGWKIGDALGVFRFIPARQMRHFCERSFPDRNGKPVFLHCLGRQLVKTKNAGGRSGCKAADARFNDRGESVKPEAGSNEPRRIRYERNFEPGSRIFLHARIHADKTDGRIGKPEIVKEFFRREW